MKSGDYLLCRDPASKKTFAMVVASASKDTVKGFLARDYHIATKRYALEVTPNSVILNLGPEPTPGKVYGATIERCLATRNHEDFGTLYFFYKPKKEATESLKRAFSMTAKMWNRNKLGFVIGDGVWEIKPTLSGATLASYARSKKPDLNPHRFRLALEKCPATDLPYALSHELAHHLHSEYLSDNQALEAAWIKLFRTSVKPSSVPKEVSLQLLQGVLSHDGPPSTYASTLGEEETNMFKWVIRTIKAFRSISIKELDLLYESGNLDVIEELWPKRAIPLKELAPVVSQYATKNYRELLAEAVAFYLTGKKLPSEVLKLTEKTLSYARKSQGA